MDTNRSPIVKAAAALFSAVTAETQMSLDNTAHVRVRSVNVVMTPRFGIVVQANVSIRVSEYTPEPKR